MVGGFLNGRLDCLTCQTSTVCTFRGVWINYFGSGKIGKGLAISRRISSRRVRSHVGSLVELQGDAPEEQNSARLFLTMLLCGGGSNMSCRLKQYSPRSSPRVFWLPHLCRCQEPLTLGNAYEMHINFRYMATDCHWVHSMGALCSATITLDATQTHLTEIFIYLFIYIYIY